MVRGGPRRPGRRARRGTAGVRRQRGAVRGRGFAALWAGLLAAARAVGATVDRLDAVVLAAALACFYPCSSP
ncbi:hypothetical protein [Halosegnis marinus]|uniref:hypothetical protein n=1 Tax=Halosegnis marinus TaxID=3034023 RepID=UPI0036243C8E